VWEEFILIMSVELQNSRSAGDILKPVASRLGAPLARAVTQGEARVLMYHRFGAGEDSRRLSATALARQLEHVVRHFRVRPLAFVVAALRAGRSLPPRTVAITVDDGYADFVEYAYPLLQRFEVPATLFTVTRFLDGDFWLWFDAVHFMLRTTRATGAQVTLGQERVVLDLSSPAARERAWSVVGDRCLRMNTAGRTAALDHLEDVLQVPLPPSPTADYRALSWAQAAALDPQLVTIGSHTCTHPVLSRCTDAEIEWETAASRQRIASRLGHEVDAFCYPNGQDGDYDARCIGAAKKAGYACATVAHGTTVGKHADVYTLERMAAPADLAEFQRAVNGITKLADQWRAWRSTTTS
jgi:peptidoglycan/xylan/chitin deacetylase (PgdA/CDA1 family)